MNRQETSHTYSLVTSSRGAAIKPINIHVRTNNVIAELLNAASRDIVDLDRVMRLPASSRPRCSRSNPGACRNLVKCLQRFPETSSLATSMRPQKGRVKLLMSTNHSGGYTTEGMKIHFCCVQYEKKPTGNTNI